MSESEDRPAEPETADGAGPAGLPDAADGPDAADVRETLDVPEAPDAGAARRSWWWRQRRWTVPVTVAAVLGGVFTGGWFAAPPDAYAPGLAASQPITLTVAQAGDRQTGRTDHWPTLGNRAGDRSQARAAMEIWLGNGSAPHTRLFRLGALDDEYGARIDSPTGQVLFSGTAVPGGPRVSLVQTGSQLLQYEGARGGLKFVYDAPAPATMSYDDGPPVALDWDGQGSGPFTLALPPWLKNVQVEGFQGKDATWRPLKSTDGVSAPLPLYQAAVGGESGPADGCGDGVLLRAEDDSDVGIHKPRVATFAYHPGWPYAVRLTYFAKPGMDSYDTTDDAAPLDQPYVRRLASALLCDFGGDIKEFQSASEVEWTQMWQGRPDAGAGRESVLWQQTTYPKGGDDFDDENVAGSVREIGIDKASDYHDLTSGMEDTQKGEVACMPVGKAMDVIGPENATKVRLLDAGTGRVWSADGHFLTVPSRELPKARSQLTAFAVTPGKGGGVASVACGGSDD